MADADVRHDPYAPLKQPNFVRYLIGSTCAYVGQAMVVTAIGWDLYDRTHDPMALAWIGLVLFIPVALLSLPAGQIADRHERRRIVMIALALMTVSSLGLAAASWSHAPLWLFYGCLLIAGTAQAFMSPAKSALLPATVPGELLSQAITWSTGASQFAFLAGPAAAGLLIGHTHSALPVYVIDAVAAGIFFVALLGMKLAPPPAAAHAPGWGEVLAGLKFVWNTKLILAGITLDMFAVLLGGAVALLPIFASDILKVGPEGLGVLTMAQSVGAFVMGLVMTHLPPFRRNGPVLLAVVVGFGLATIGFGLSKWMWLSWAMLFLAGAFDMVSMIIRSNLVQTLTPDAMRGRVMAVHGIFVGTSNELGGFESGLTASWWGPVRSVLFGGMGTLVVVALVAALVPGLRRLGVIEAPREEAEAPAA